MKHKLEKTKETGANSPITRSNRFYIQLKGYGHCDDNEKTVMGVGMSGKKIPSQPDRPLALMAALIEEMLPAMDWSSEEALAKDLASFQKWTASLTITKKVTKE
jgi:hypothetical protein